ncbi:MAG: hypothetical protein J5992_09190 [Oscillospiraceae bacterium]|nr:hypothetical protein [Oscillospiraceae bacterium]
MTLSQYTEQFIEFVALNKEYYFSRCSEFLKNKKIRKWTEITETSLKNAKNEEFAGLCNEIFVINAFLESKRMKYCFESCYIDTYFLKNKKINEFVIFKYNQKIIIYFKKEKLIA